jgi:sugar O-acyltransferase (sialic acid O-acetyltransferase NeuD family)
VIDSNHIYVIGAGGHGKVVIATLRDAGYVVAGVLDDNPVTWRKTVLGLPVLGPATKLLEVPTAKAVLAIGSNAVRQSLARQLMAVDWLTVIHPTAYVHPSVKVGCGTVVFAGAVLQPDAEVGCHCIVNTAVTVDHDCHIEDFVHLAPGVHLAGSVTVGAGTLMGIASAAIPGIHIGKSTVIGAGATVISDIPDNVTAVGSPARIKTSQP